MTKSMTEGNETKLILSFALPLLLGNLLQQTYNLIDAAIVGQVLGRDALGAVGASSSVQFLVMGFCIGVCTGFGIPLARLFGANDIKQLKNNMYNGILLAGFFAVVITAITCIFCPEILHYMKTPDNLFKNAYNYLFIIFLGIPFCFLYNYQASILRAVGDSRTPFIFLAMSTVLNIILDFFFILVVPLGCAGAAIATITSQAVSGICCLIYFRKRYQILHLGKDDMVFRGRVAGEMLVMGVPTGLQFSITAFGCMVMQSANNNLGDIYISAFTAGNRIKQFAMCPFDAVATGVSVFVSQNLGAGKVERIKKGILKGIMVGVIYGFAIGIILMLFGSNLSRMFIKAHDVEVIKAAGQFTFIAGLFFWMLAVLATTRMTIQGLGYAGIAIISGVLEMIARIAVSKTFVPKYGFKAICFTDQSAWVTAMIYCVIVCIIVVKRVTKKRLQNTIQ